jgi:conjugal transfer pilus assembly protein TraW
MGLMNVCGLYGIIAPLSAKDLGIQGHLFPIEEEDLLESLKNKIAHLSENEVNMIQGKVQNHYATQVQNPSPIPSLQEAKVYHLFYLNPTICAEEEIKDHKGHMVVTKGKCFNPLETIVHLDALLFFDAANPMHLAWAKRENQRNKWVLVKGQPLELEEQENRPVYFDQLGILVKKFNIHHLPAKVSRDGLQLKIEEFPLKG